MAPKLIETEKHSILTGKAIKPGKQDFEIIKSISSLRHSQQFEGSKLSCQVENQGSKLTNSANDYQLKISN